jgi:hypothetical protein
MRRAGSLLVAAVVVLAVGVALVGGVEGSRSRAGDPHPASEALSVARAPSVRTGSPSSNGTLRLRGLGLALGVLAVALSLAPDRAERLGPGRRRSGPPRPWVECSSSRGPPLVPALLP